MRRLRAILAFIRHQEWVEEPKWLEGDARALTEFLGTATGRKLSRILLNLTVRQNSSAVQKKPEALAQACGWAMGFRGAVATIESLTHSNHSPVVPDDANGADDQIVD